MSGVDHKRILFITRKYPPIHGGMESYSWEFYQALQKHRDVTLIANPWGNRYLMIFLIQVFVHLILFHRSYHYIHLGDGVLAPLIWCFKWWGISKWSITLHGLDITFEHPLYQKWLIPSLNQFDQLVWVSHETKQQCRKRGIHQKGQIIPNGIVMPDTKPSRVNSTHDKIILYSIGRLVRRKGIKEFIENILPYIDYNMHYLVAGTGEMEARIRQTIRDHDMISRVTLLGSISDEEKERQWSEVDLFIMPNIRVKGDMEGFGRTLIEAGSYGVPSVARGIEGITTAVIEGKTGYLVPDDSVAAYQKAILEALKLDRVSVQQATRDHFSWDRVIEQYITKIFI